jgi:hypothetical protein
MGYHKKITLVAILIVILASAAPAAALEGEADEVPPCGGENVSGTVVTVDEEAGTVTIDTGDGLCTVALDGEYDHPIVALLGSYFDDVSAESLKQALEDTQGCAVYDSDSGTWTWEGCGSGGTVAATIVGDNGDGTFQAIVDGVEVTVVVANAATAETLSDALQALAVQWNLDEDGVLIQAGDEIAAYHDAGMGFGVLVKLYAMALESQKDCDDEEGACGVTVEELVKAFVSGTGMGELFKEYGKPSTVGIGHVRKIMRSGTVNGDQPYHASTSRRFRPSRHTSRPENAGPKKAALRQEDETSGDDLKPASPAITGKPDNAGPKPKPSDHGGKPDHAGPKPKPPNRGGKPDRAGPKPKPNGK